MRLRPRVAWILPIHHLLTGYSCGDKSTSFMQGPYDRDFDVPKKVCTSLTWVDQTKWSIRSDITTEQPAFIQLFDHVLFRPISHDQQYARPICRWVFFVIEEFYIIKRWSGSLAIPAYS